MEILKILDSYSKQRNLRFILIGGQALNVHGYARQTGDLDILVRKSDRTAWCELLETLGYKLFQKHEVFHRFRPGQLAAWPIDLMFVDDSTFDQFQNSAIDGNFGTVNVPVASAEHIIFLKLHALKYGAAHRTSKDILDIIELARLTGMDLSSEEFRRRCERYGTMEVHQKILKLTHDE